MNVCFFNIHLVSTCKIQHCQLFVFAWDMSFPQRCLILSFLLVWKDQDRIWQEVTLCFSSHSIKQMAHFYSNRKSNITAVGHFTQTLHLPFMQILSVCIFSTLTSFLTTRTFTIYPQSKVTNPALIFLLCWIHAHGYTDTHDLLTDQLVWTCFLGRTRLLSHYEPQWYFPPCPLP